MDHTDVEMEDLFGEQLELAECIGIDAYRNLVQVYAGQSVYVAKVETILIDKRNTAIRREYNGRNVRALAIKYNLSESTIRLLVSSERRRIENAPTEGQMHL